MRVFARLEPKGTLLEEARKIFEEKCLKSIYLELDEKCSTLPKDSSFQFELKKRKKIKEKTTFWIFKSIEATYLVADKTFIIFLKLDSSGNTSNKDEKKFLKKWKTDWRDFKKKKK